MKKKIKHQKKSNSTNIGFEEKLWAAADKMRNNMDPAEYKHVVLGLIFLKYISDSFEELHAKLLKDKHADPEDRDEYLAKNVFWVPKKARWSYLRDNAKKPEIGKMVDDAMIAVEKDNASVKGVLSKNYARPDLDKTRLGEIIDLISNIGLGDKVSKSKDVLGRIYEYFLGRFASAEGTGGGEFYTPQCVVKILVAMLEPYKGRVFDPCCGSGGMFVMSEKFVEDVIGGNIQDITIYGQESNQTTWKLSKMNLAIRNINSKFVAWNTEGTFLKDEHPDIKADYILANPPFNQSEWGADILAEDGRWKYGTPPNGNANFAWMQHMIYHLSPNGVMATVLSNGSLSSTTSGEGVIREKIVRDNLVECIIALPKQLFYNTGIPATIWILRRGRDQKDSQTLFIDASELGYMKTRVIRDFKDNEIAKIEETYKRWRNKEGYEDIAGFCKSATLEEIAEHDFVLTPGRYVGIVHEEDDDTSFEEKMEHLTSTLAKQMEQEKSLDDEIKEQLSKIGYSL